MFDVTKFTWMPKELPCKLSNERIEMTTLPKTDLWQKTLGFPSEDNAPLLQMETEAEHFCFTVKAEFSATGLYDQCGIVLHMDENTWLKASMEYEDGIRHLGSVVTNNGYSDWAATDVSAECTEMWYRLTRVGSDFQIDSSKDGVHYSVLRMCHMWNLDRKIRFGLYACSPKESSFTAVFTEMDYCEQ